MRPNYAPNLPAALRRRQRIETEIEGHLARVEILLARLDRQDGDPDLEDATDAEDDFTFSPLAQQYRRTLGAGCPISDPGGGNVEDEIQADTDNGTDMLKTLPLYAADQTKGPINETIAYQRHRMLSCDRGRPDLDREVRKKLKQLDRREAALPYC
jgi:hypothetical protein